MDDKQILDLYWERSETLPEFLIGNRGPFISKTHHLADF